METIASIGTAEAAGSFQRSAERIEPAAIAAQVRSLLDARQPRTSLDLDLAEAILAVRFPDHWPGYRGRLDPSDVDRALALAPLEEDDLRWLASPAFMVERQSAA